VVIGELSSVVLSFLRGRRGEGEEKRVALMVTVEKKRGLRSCPSLVTSQVGNSHPIIMVYS